VQSAQPCPGWTWRPISALLAVLGLVSTAYLPVQYVWSVRGALGRRSAVLFFSPDCPECRQSRPLLTRILRSAGWTRVRLLDSRLTSNQLIRLQFDRAYHIPEHQKGQLPALFYPGGSIVGVGELRAAARSGIPRSAGSNRATVGFPWAQWVDMLTAGTCCVLLSMLLRCRSSRTLRVSVALLAAIFVGSGAAKLVGRAQFANLVKHMAIVPPGIADIVWLFGVLEIAVALGLAHGRWRPVGAGGAALMMVGFVAITMRLLASGYTGNCGCLPWRDQVGWWTVARDLGLLSLCVAVYRCTTMGRLPYPAGHRCPEWTRFA